MLLRVYTQSIKIYLRDPQAVWNSGNLINDNQLVDEEKQKATLSLQNVLFFGGYLFIYSFLR